MKDCRTKKKHWNTSVRYIDLCVAISAAVSRIQVPYSTSPIQFVVVEAAFKHFSQFFHFPFPLVLFLVFSLVSTVPFLIRLPFIFLLFVTETDDKNRVLV